MNRYKYIIFIVLFLVGTKVGCSLPTLPENKFNRGQIVWHTMLKKECQVVEVYKNLNSLQYEVRYRDNFGNLNNCIVKEFELSNERFELPNERFELSK